jgi:hypothetical protein
MAIYDYLYLNIAQIEYDKFNYLFSHIDKSNIIKSCKKYYKKKSISLRTNLKSPITIQTEKKKVTISRYHLSPVTAEERERLFELEKCYGIYPLNRIIGISSLPFKMTVNAMLKVSKKKAQHQKSFKSAIETLKDDCGIIMDVSTLLSVTNHIGYLVFKNDCARAHQMFNLFDSAKIIFPERKKDGILYIQIDGAMVNIREKDKAGSGLR